MLPRLPGKRLLFRLNAAPVHANHANRASAFAVSRIIDPSRLADPKAFVNPDYFASDSTKPDYALNNLGISSQYPAPLTVGIYTFTTDTGQLRYTNFGVDGNALGDNSDLGWIKAG